MIAGLLHFCGLDPGPKNDLLSPAPNNPVGFWESRSFLRLNDASLKELGGSWDCPPHRVVSGWGNEPGQQRLRQKAQRLVDCFADRESWGWKDPRNCLTLPLWREMLPAMKILICVPNPAAVAESLWLRDGICSSEAFDLWLTYNCRVLSAAPVEHRLVTHYETFLDDPSTELHRVLNLAGLSSSDDTVDQARQRIASSLMHHRRTLDDLTRAGTSDELLLCYLHLCDEATLLRGATPVSVS
jgi:hypothetical protein